MLMPQYLKKRYGKQLYMGFTRWICFLDKFEDELLDRNEIQNKY